LRQFAATGGGRYVQLEGEGRPLAGLAAEFQQLESTTFATEETATPVERFQIFAGVALVLGLAATALQLFRWPAARRALRLWPVAGASIFIAGICAADAADLNRRGNRQYDASEFGRAVDSYRTAQALSPSQSELFHNAGNALERDGDFGAAIDETARGLPADEDRVEAALEYALGNHYSGAQRLEEALEAYRRALIADPLDFDAKHNFELTARRLTPTATPTEMAVPPELESSSTPDPTDPAGAGGTPGPTGSPETGGTPQPGGEDIPPEQLKRLLEEALAGIDDEFTVEEALRVLELLEQRNRDQLGDGVAGAPGLPDY
jgi:tetratricopeptide (TPR) repeat protein